MGLREGVGLQSYHGAGVLEASHMGAEDKHTLKLYTKCFLL